MLIRRAVPQQNKLAKRHSREGGNPVLFAYFKVLNTTVKDSNANVCQEEHFVRPLASELY